MTKLQRKIYLLFFVALFLVTAPVIVLFAQGYRFDRSGKIFIYSGSITIKSWPRDIDIYVNGKKQDRKKLNAINNSYTINGIRPGKYSLRCEKEGYTSWSKNIVVRSGISTEFWNVILFPIKNRDIVNHPPSGVEQFFLSPRDEDEIVYFSRNDGQRRVSILDSQSNEYEEIFSTRELDFLDKQSGENVEWSSDNKRILIPFSDQEQKKYIIARIRKENLRDIINLNDLFLQSQQAATSKEGLTLSDADQEYASDQQDGIIEKARWMFDKNDELVILTREHNLYYFNIEKPEQLKLLDQNVSGFDFAGNRIYYSQLPNNIVWEVKNDDIGTKSQITNTPLPMSENDFIKLTVYDQYRMAFITENKDLYIYNNEKEEAEITFEKIIANADDIQFSDDGKKLLYWSSSEIWCLMLRKWEVQPLRSKGDRIFVTRLSSPLSNVQWMDDYENIVFSSDHYIKSASIDNRDHSNIVDLFKLDQQIQNRQIIYSKPIQKLFFINKINGDSALQSTLLIDKTGFLGF